jgi:hypothetical protein
MPANPTASAQKLDRAMPENRFRIEKKIAPTTASGTKKMSNINGSQPVWFESLHPA